jgi:Mn2+/Fe2+ NRAMP family transporter
MNSTKADPDKPPYKRANVLLRLLGPGLVTGAADDDPSGIATYSQAGAQFGYGLLWTVFLTTPFMIAIQLVSAQIGRVTGKGIIANVKDFAPPLAGHITRSYAGDGQHVQHRRRSRCDGRIALARDRRP